MKTIDELNVLLDEALSDTKQKRQRVKSSNEKSIEYTDEELEDFKYWEEFWAFSDEVEYEEPYWDDEQSSLYEVDEVLDNIVKEYGFNCIIQFLEKRGVTF